MQPNVIEIKAMIHDAGLSDQVSPVASVLEAYEKLTTAEGPLTPDEEAILFETAMLIGQQGFGEKGPAAFQTVANLIESRGLSTFRPEPPVEETVEDPPQP